MTARRCLVATYLCTKSICTLLASRMPIPVVDVVHVLPKPPRFLRKAMMKEKSYTLHGNNPVDEWSGRDSGNNFLRIDSSSSTQTNKTNVEDGITIKNTPKLVDHNRNHPFGHLPELGNFTTCQDTSPFFNKHFSLVQDHLSPLWWRSIHGNDQQSNIPSINNPFGNGKLLIIIGDSLDRKMTDYVCQIMNGTKTKEEPNRELAHPFVCVSPMITTVYLNIFGMDTDCTNDGAKLKVELREFNHTAERISTILPTLFGLLPPSGNNDPPSDVFIQIGSHVWDLTEGCNNHIGIDEQYEQRYRRGIRRVHTALQDTVHSHFPTSKISILWKMAAPISLKFSNQLMERGDAGMVRMNQEALITILQNETGASNLGEGYVDVWNHIQRQLSLPEDVLDGEMELDGYHYTKCAGLVFFNLFLDAIWKLHDGPTVQMI